MQYFKTKKKLLLVLVLITTNVLADSSNNNEKEYHGLITVKANLNGDGIYYIESDFLTKQDDKIVVKLEAKNIKKKAENFSKYGYHSVVLHMWIRNIEANQFNVELKLLGYLKAESKEAFELNNSRYNYVVLQSHRMKGFLRISNDFQFKYDDNSVLGINLKLLSPKDSLANF